MRVHQENPSDTSLLLTVEALTEDLHPLKEHVLAQFRNKVKVPGFREGKAPLSLIEKQVDSNLLQSEFLEEAVNHLYSAVIDQQKIRPVSRPEVQVTKFVPFTELSFTAKVAVIGPIKLADYKHIKKSKPVVKITTKDITDVLTALQQRGAERQAVTRASKNGDELVIDFAGKDQAGQVISGADGKDYPLILGSNTFIPGFEKHLIGLRPNQQTKFTITFPKDYGVKALQSKKVTFEVSVKQVQELKSSKPDDAFAAKVSPFKSLAELKADIRKQLTQEKQQEALSNLQNEIISEIVKKSKLAIPEVLVDEQIQILLQQEQQNMTYRGQTFAEFLKQAGQTEEQYRQEVLRPQAEERVKAGLVLSEIAEQEKLTVTPEELEVQLQILKGQYQDPQMQAELAKPEARRDIASRILTQKTVDRLVELATK